MSNDFCGLDYPQYQRNNKKEYISYIYEEKYANHIKKKTSKRNI